jgi:hypothetical protein
VQVAFVAQVSVAIYGNLVGVARRDAENNAWTARQGPKYYITFLMIYVVVLVSVKCAISITIYRIAVQKSHQIAIWCLLVFNWLAFLVLMIGVNLYCRPLRAMWTPELIESGEGECSPVSVLVNIGEVATWFTIVSDFALAILPYLILRGTNMTKGAKIQVFALLSFASV